MKKIAFTLAALSLAAAGPALAHGDMKPKHGGIVQMSGETLFEMVRSPAGVSIYVTDDEEPVLSAKGSGKLSVTAGGKTQTVVLKPGPVNRFDAPGLKLATGAKVAVQVVDGASQARLNTVFVIK